jgi:peptidoglycan/LPS O-acetylase OafA/YrhL
LDSGRQPDIELARVLAIVAIFSAHIAVPGVAEFGLWVLGRLPFAIDSGELGVAIFLTISGLTLCCSLARAGDGWALLLRRRVARIFGMYWFVAVPVLLLLYVPSHGPQSIRHAVVWLCGLGFISQATYTPPVSAWWYVALAWQVVVVAPLLVTGARRMGPLFMSAIVAMVAVAASHWAVGLHGALFERMLVTSRLTEVWGGMLLAGVMWDDVRGRLGGGSRRRWLVAAVVVIFFEIAAATFATWWVARGVGMLVVVVLGAAAPVARTAPARAVSLIRWLGALTYPFFLTHLLVIGLLVSVPIGWRALLAFSGSWAIAWLVARAYRWLMSLSSVVMHR